MMGTGERRRVLVVDDDSAVREVMLLALSDEGHEVLAAADGIVALAMAREYAPDIVLLDYNMPRCDARCFMANYHQQPGQHAPIILVTAATDAARRAAEVGADAYLGKPFDLTDLLDKVDQVAA